MEKRKDTKKKTEEKSSEFGKNIIFDKQFHSMY